MEASEYCAIKEVLFMDKRAQGLPITTIIIAILGIVVLVILFAITTGRLTIFARTTAECPGTCIGEWKGTTTAKQMLTTDRACESGLETEQVGNYIKTGQPIGMKPEDIVKCTRCCVPIA